jgi:hypothetical protein
MMRPSKQAIDQADLIVIRTLRRESDVAVSRRPSFLKRQKEQQRTARALEKREARRLKKRGRETAIEESAGPDAAENPAEGIDQPGEADPSDEK